MRETAHNNPVKIRREPEARITLCKCKETKRIYGVRMEKAQGGWNYTWAFPISVDSAKREGYDITVLKGTLGKTSEYNGCPYCGEKYFVVCDNCRKLNCKIISGDTFTCEWCGNTGRIVNYDGAGVESGGDR